MDGGGALAVTNWGMQDDWPHEDNISLVLLSTSCVCSVAKHLWVTQPPKTSMKKCMRLSQEMDDGLEQDACQYLHMLAELSSQQPEQHPEEAVHKGSQRIRARMARKAQQQDQAADQEGHKLARRCVSEAPSFIQVVLCEALVCAWHTGHRVRTTPMNMNGRGHNELAQKCAYDP